MSLWRNISKFDVAIAALFGLIAWFSSTSDVRAEVHISGTKEAAMLEAQNASLQEIVSAINSAFKVQIELKASIERSITGRYSGSIRHVLLRMLEGHDYIVKTSGDQISVMMPTPGINGVSSKSVAALGAAAQARAIRNDPADAGKPGVQGWTGGFSGNNPSPPKPPK